MPDWRYLFIRSLGLLGGLVAECRARNARTPGSISPTFLEMCQERLAYWWALISAQDRPGQASADTPPPPPEDTADSPGTPQ
jgi:hypothetical protein